LVISTCSKVLL